MIVDNVVGVPEGLSRVTVTVAGVEFGFMSAIPVLVNSGSGEEP